VRAPFTASRRHGLRSACFNAAQPASCTARHTMGSQAEPPTILCARPVKWREGGLRIAGIRTTLLWSLTSAFRVDAGASVETPVKWRSPRSESGSP
jgi:hypothetical protein